MSDFEMNELVKRLTVKQAITANPWDKVTVERLKESVDRGYVQIKFTLTQGGTELGVKLDQAHCDFTKADWAAKTGIIKVGGELSLNYENVRLHAEVDLSTLDGEGYLEYLGPTEEWRKKKFQEQQQPPS